MPYILAVFAASFLVAMSGAMTPGPLLTVTISQTAQRGFRAAALITLGHSLLELLLVVALALGFGAVLEAAMVKGAIGLVGGLVLVWMGATMLRDARRGSIDFHVEGSNTQDDRAILRSPLFLGAIVSLTNPYWVVWWATIGLAFFATLSTNAFVTVAAFYVGHVLGDAAWYLAVGAAVSKGREFISPSVYRVVIGVCGAVLIGLGGMFLYSVASGGIWRAGADGDAPRRMIDSIRGWFAR